MLLVYTLVFFQVIAYSQENCQFDPTLRSSVYWRAFKDTAYLYDVFTVERVTSYLRKGGNQNLEEQWQCVEGETAVELGFRHYRYIVSLLQRGNFECREYIDGGPSGLLLKRIIAGVNRPSMEECKRDLQGIYTHEVLLRYEQGIPHVGPCPWASGDFATVIDSSTDRCDKNPAIVSRVRGNQFTIGDCDIKDKLGRELSGDMFCITTWEGGTINPTAQIPDDYVTMYQYDARKDRPAFYVGRYRQNRNGSITLSLKVPDDHTASFDTRVPPTFVNEDHIRLNLLRLTTVTPAPTRTTTRFKRITTGPRTTTRRPARTTRRPPGDQPCRPDINPCLNEGICNGRGFCECPTGVSGKLCQIQVMTTVRRGSALVLPTLGTLRTTRRPHFGRPCNLGTICLNGGTCSTRNTCLCSQGYRGRVCQIMDSSGTTDPPDTQNGGTASTTGSSSFKTPIITKPTTTTTPRPSSDKDSAESSEDAGTSAPSGGEPFNSTALLFNENEERQVFIILVTFCVSFAVFSAILCIVACCRRKRPVFGGDKKSDTLPVSPPSTQELDESQVRRSGQVWYSQDKFRRGSGGDDNAAYDHDALEIHNY